MDPGAFPPPPCATGRHGGRRQVGEHQVKLAEIEFFVIAEQKAGAAAAQPARSQLYKKGSGASSMPTTRIRPHAPDTAPAAQAAADIDHARRLAIGSSWRTASHTAGPDG
jgi:hypothetical protein